MSTRSDRVLLVTVMLSGSFLLQANEPALAAASDWCLGRVETSLANLASSLGALDAAQEAPLRAELLAVCQEAQATNSTTMNPQAGSTDPGSTAEDSTTILGVEIRRAPDGADGYDRVRK